MWVNVSLAIITVYVSNIYPVIHHFKALPPRSPKQCCMKISEHFVHTSTRQHRKVEGGGGKRGRLQTTFATHYSIFAINLFLFSIHRYFVDYFWLAERIGQEMRNWPQERKLMEMKLKMDKDGCNKMNLPFQREQPSWCLLYLHTPKIITQVLPWYLKIYLLVQLTYPGRKPQNSQALIF